ncbi:hypothetical protein MUK42_18396 [Musa troglodytarum]|uniref:Uncharacterized protein n=1 Tax=Musa troglodytarum TaxID=320322 RepID=A0A9E7FUH4_9LILI|nr:hypothetical protein MUK42_18396 [Musa troglodytarum]
MMHKQHQNPPIGIARTNPPTALADRGRSKVASVDVAVQALAYLFRLPDKDGHAVELGHLRHERGMGGTQWLGLCVFDGRRRDRPGSQSRRHRPATYRLTNVAERFFNMFYNIYTLAITVYFIDRSKTTRNTDKPYCEPITSGGGKPRIDPSHISDLTQSLPSDSFSLCWWLNSFGCISCYL